MNDMNIRILRSGFTLIELLVTISIIGILAAIIYANFGDAKEDAKNKVLRAEMKELQLAIELYKAQHGRYPIATASCDYSGGIGMRKADTDTCGAVEIIEGHTAGVTFTPDFIADLPAASDSANSACKIVYMVPNDGTWYKLTAKNCHGGATSAAEGVQPADEMATCILGCDSSFCSAANVVLPAFYETYAVYSAGGECKPD